MGAAHFVFYFGNKMEITNQNVFLSLNQKIFLPFKEIAKVAQTNCNRGAILLHKYTRCSPYMQSKDLCWVWFATNDKICARSRSKRQMQSNYLCKLPKRKEKGGRGENSTIYGLVYIHNFNFFLGIS